MVIERARAAMTAERIRHTAGVASLGLIIVGIWGLAGWEWAAIAAGLLPAAFYVFGEARAAFGRAERTE